MKVSELIEFLKETKRTYGDVVLFTSHDDGRSTFGLPIKPSVNYRRIWPGHSQPKQWYIKL